MCLVLTVRITAMTRPGGDGIYRDATVDNQGNNGLLLSQTGVALSMLCAKQVINQGQIPLTPGKRQYCEKAIYFQVHHSRPEQCERDGKLR